LAWSLDWEKWGREKKKIASGVTVGFSIRLAFERDPKEHMTVSGEYPEKWEQEKREKHASVELSLPMSDSCGSDAMVTKGGARKVNT